MTVKLLKPILKYAVGELVDTTRQRAKEWYAAGIAQPTEERFTEVLPDKKQDNQITVVHIHTTPDEIQEIEEE
jgi:hypothetical protein